MKEICSAIDIPGLHYAITVLPWSVASDAASPTMTSWSDIKSRLISIKVIFESTLASLSTAYSYTPSIRWLSSSPVNTCMWVALVVSHWTNTSYAKLTDSWFLGRWKRVFEQQFRCPQTLRCRSQVRIILIWGYSVYFISSDCQSTMIGCSKKDGHYIWYAMNVS